MTHSRTVQLLAETCAIYIPNNCEAIRIMSNNPVDGCFYGEGEDSGASYEILYSEVNIDEDMFYKLVPVGPKDLNSLVA